jgi:hypothetical protein
VARSRAGGAADERTEHGHRTPSRALRCQLVFGASDIATAEVAASARAVFGVELAEDDDDRIEVPAFTWRAPAAGAGPIRRIQARPNRRRRSQGGARLFDDPSSELLLVTLDTHVLLELGRIAAAVRSACGERLAPIAYRVHGEVAGDGVERCLTRTYGAGAREAK